MGKVGGGDQGPEEGDARLARHLRQHRGRGARLRHCRAALPWAPRQAQLLGGGISPARPLVGSRSHVLLVVDHELSLAGFVDCWTTAAVAVRDDDDDSAWWEPWKQRSRHWEGIAGTKRPRQLRSLHITSDLVIST
uniref:Uncharacterized protein n=1 Tax=Oryza punctata TaxID=4537 RepID=A0A0E0K0W8_ORYPU